MTEENDFYKTDMKTAMKKIRNSFYYYTNYHSFSKEGIMIYAELTLCFKEQSNRKPKKEEYEIIQEIANRLIFN